MPELPEVETTCKGLHPLLTGQKIMDVTVRQPRLRMPVPTDFAVAVAGQVVTRIHRRAKYILLDLSSGQTVLIHLGMSGRLTKQPSIQAPAKHDHVLFHLHGGVDVRYHDPRRFGLVTLTSTAQLFEHVLLASLGPEPLAADFSADYLYEQLQRRTVPIKNAVMDQNVVVGVGNIYANEALFRAGVRPDRTANSLNKAEVMNLFVAIQAVLHEAIAAGGTTLRDYVQADGALGYYHEQFKVYGRDGQACLACGGEVQKMVVGQRGTWWCPHCQH